MTRGIRGLAWVLVVALAGFQAYAQRYAVGPDGVAYLDLSDAVVAGHWGGLVNLYWSPLYPLLIGAARLVARPTPAAEVPLVHVVNALAFIATFSAYEYFLTPVLRIASDTRHAVLGGPWGRAAAYALFVCVAFTLTPIELTTPDLLAAAATFAALGALLRLQRSAGNAGSAALVLGVSLGLGGLAKSFMIPWAIVCFAVAAIALRKHGLGRVATAMVLFLVFVGPWTAALTRAVRRLTFGDTGRMTYAWYVNHEDAPSLGGVPMGARTARTEAILPGSGVTGDAPGTDPMWFDPDRWKGPVAPHFNVHDQFVSLTISGRFYVENLAPFLFLILLIAVAPAASRRDAWRRTWVVLVPVSAGMLGYAMVLVTARYFMAFALAGTLVLLATLPVPRRVHPLAMLVGVAIPIGLESIDDRSAVALALVVSIVGAMLAGSALGTGGRVDGWTGGRRFLWAIGVLAAAAITHVILPAAFPGILLLGGAVLAVILWAMSRAAIRAWHPVRFAHDFSGALALVVATLLVLRLGARLGDDRAALDRAGSPTWGNLQANVAADLLTHGIGPGTPIAVIGPHADSYWARTGRLKIVASVPTPVVPAFWRLSHAGRDSLLGEFAAAGARVAIASVGPNAGAPPPDSGWTPVRYRGWIRFLEKGVK